MNLIRPLLLLSSARWIVQMLSSGSRAMRRFTSSSHAAVYMLFALSFHDAAAGGSQGKGPTTVNGLFAARQQAVAASAAANAQSRASHGFSVMHGNNGVTLIRIKDPTIRPSEALRSFKSDGKVYAIDRNGVLYGGAQQVNTHALVAAAMGATNNSPNQIESQKRSKPVQIEVPSIVIVEVVRFGE